MYHRPGYDPSAIINNTKRFPLRAATVEVQTVKGAMWNPEMTVGIAAVPAIRRGFNGQVPRGMNGRTVASDCVSVSPTGTRSIFKPARKSRKNKVTRRVSTKDRAAIYEKMLYQFGATGNID